METILPYILQAIGGAGGGNAIGAILKNLNLSAILRTITGLIGGVAGGKLAALIPALTSMLEGNGAEAMAGNAGAGLAGGAILTAIVGIIKKAMGSTAAPTA